MALFERKVHHARGPASARRVRARTPRPAGPPAAEPELRLGPHPRLVAVARRTARVSAVAAAGIGSMVLAGWLLHVPVLTSPWPAAVVSTKVNAALGLVLLGGSLWLVLEGAGPRR